jgi:Flp pilus assembly pilin Flp
MTEYLIILSIVAVAAIAVVGLFGKQIKQAFTSNTAAMAGTSVANTDQHKDSDVKADDMGTFKDEVKAQ